MPEYYITRLGDKHFKIAKFDGGDQPENVYYLVMTRKGEPGHRGGDVDPSFNCDCPNRRRNKHVNDKHGLMVAKWLLQGEPQGAFNDGKHYGTPANDLPGGDEEDYGPDPDC